VVVDAYSRNQLPGQSIVRGARGVRVTAAPHPFQVKNVLRLVPEGATLAQILELFQPDPWLRESACIFIRGEIVPRNWWHRIKPKEGTHVEIRVMPMGGGGGGGGKNPLRILLTVAVMGAAFTFGPSVGAGLFNTSAQTAVLGGVTAGAIGTALVGAVGLLLINAVAPVRPPRLPQLSGTEARESPTAFIEGARNQARPFQPIPVILGKRRMVPPYGAQPYTEVIGDKHYFRAVFVWGIGPISIDTSSIKIGETPITDFDGVELEHREGYSTDAPLTLYPDTVNQENLSIELTSAVGWQTRTAEPSTDELSIDITLPRGLTYFQSGGGRSNQSVVLQIQFRAVGDVSWSTPTFTAKTVPDSWVVGDTVTFTHAKAVAIRHGFRWSVPTRGQYEVRVQRVTADSTDDAVVDDMVWTALRSFKNEDPINSSVPVATTAVRILATGQLNGIIDELNGIVTSIGKDWDAAASPPAWVDDMPIQNPAAVYRLALQGNGSINPLPDSRLDLDGIQEWYETCDARSWTYNRVHDFESSWWEVLADIAAAGRAAPGDADGKVSIVREEIQAAPASHITPRNSYNYKGEKAFPDVPHGWRIEFFNEDEGYRHDERRVFQDGYDQDTATIYESLELPGVTRPDQVYQLGRFRIAQAILQPERSTVEQDMEFLTHNRGDWVVVTHDVLQAGLTYGRIKAVTVDGSNNVTAVELDEPVTMQAATDYGLSIRNVLGQVEEQIVTAVGDQTSVTFSTPVPNVSGSAAIAVNDVFGFGLLGSETDDYSVLTIEPDGEMRARVVLVPYRESMFTADTETIPPFVTNLTPLPEIPAPVIRNVVSDESALARGPGDSLITQVVIDFDPLTDPELNNPRIEVQGRISGSGAPYDSVVLNEISNNRVVIGDVNDGETWDFRLRWVVDLRLPGPWSEVSNNTIIGKTSAPSGLSGLTISAWGGGAYLRWDQPQELDVIFGGTVRFRHSQLTSGATWQESVGIGESAFARTRWALLPLKPGTYLARVFDVTGRASADIATVTTKQATVLTYASADTLDEGTAFAGTHSNTVSIGGVLKLKGTSLMDDWGLVDDITEWDGEGGVAVSGTYGFASGFDFSSVGKYRLTTRLTVISTNPLDKIDSRTDLIDTWEDFDGTTQAQGDVTVEVRHTDDDPASSSPTWSSWERLDSAEFEARGFEFRAILTSSDPAFNIEVSELGVDAEDLV